MTTGLGVLLADRHVVLMQALAHVLVDLPGVTWVTTASTGADVYAQLALERPDVVVCDVELVHGDRTELPVPLLSPDGHDVPLLLTSAAHDHEAVLRFLADGGRGWVPKDAPLSELAEALLRVAAGHVHLASADHDVLLDRLVEQARRAAPPPTFLDDLTPRQLEVLQGVVDGLSQVEVAQRLVLSPATVRTHLRHLRELAPARSTTALVGAALAAGLVPGGPAEDPWRRSIG